MAQSKPKEEKVAEAPRVCVCGRQPLTVKHKGHHMLSCPVPTECAMRSRWAKTEQAAIKDWNVRIESAKHERRQ